MKPLSEVHFRVIDHGLFFHLARRLARDAGRVSYWSPWEKAFPLVQDVYGDGFEEVERVNHPWWDDATVDCWVFPDIGFSGFQERLIADGKVVWGARGADLIETSRGRFLEVLEHVGLPVPPHTKIKGMESLRAFLKDKKDLYIKVSKFRGDWETLHWRSWDQDENQLAVRATYLGPWKEHLTFYAFENIKTEIEDGCDTYCIDGQFPSLVVHGMEAKDKAFLGAFQSFKDLPKELQVVNDRMAPVLAAYKYRSFFSTEVRITKEGQSYFIDPTMRAGSPPSQVMSEMMGNFSEIVWQGSQGNLLEPKPEWMFGVQAMVSSDHSGDEWGLIEMPNELDRSFKPWFCSKIDGVLAFPPVSCQTGGDIGWLIGLGDTPKEAIEDLQYYSKQLPDGCKCHFHCIADLLKEVEAAEKSGMEFSDQPMPEPEIVLQDTR